MNDIWIAGIARGHNAGVCLLKNGEIVFSIEEERLTRMKYDGAPLASMTKILEYTDKLDYLAISHTQPDESRLDFSGDKIYYGLARKLRLINDPDQVIELDKWHHKMHAATAFYRSGFDEAVALIVDGAGTFIPMNINNEQMMTWELESIIDCDYPADFNTLYKHQGSRGPHPGFNSRSSNEQDDDFELILDDTAGIVKAYEAVTQYCGWQPIEAGKTMGLFPYGEPNDRIPDIYTDDGGRWKTTNRALIIPTYPNGALVNAEKFDELSVDFGENDDVTLLQNRRDMAYAVQTGSQSMVLDLIRKAVEISGKNNVVLSGGYGLNCVANYWYLNELKDEDINLYVEPISNDAGTAMGAALLVHHTLNEDAPIHEFAESLYLGPTYEYSRDDIDAVVEKYNGRVIISGSDAEDAVKLILDGNIVTLFQGGCENGPRALGNRSILYDPRTLDGKDYVNSVKHREYFRPFAGSILHEYADEWFDMRGLEESPHMMYAMDCTSEEYAKQIPAIIHVDQTCRIQTVKEHQNPVFYEMIQVFFEHTGVPILFNTSFNLGGEPLVETLDDAVRTLANSDIEYLYLPENGVIIKVEND
jgi:carbamoyltransferase